MSGNGGIVCHEGPMVEAFPNAFLGVSMPEIELPSAPKLERYGGRFFSESREINNVIELASQLKNFLATRSIPKGNLAQSHFMTVEPTPDIDHYSHDSMCHNTANHSNDHHQDRFFVIAVAKLPESDK